MDVGLCGMGGMWDVEGGEEAGAWRGGGKGLKKAG